MMPQERFNIVWGLTVELRRELVELQRLRSQVVGLKITFVSAVVGLIAANIDKVPIQLLVIPAFASIFFDLLVNGHNVSIKRIGSYCRKYLEPVLAKSSSWPKSNPLWEEYLAKQTHRGNLVPIAQLGITGLAVVVAMITLFMPFDWRYSVPLLVVLGAFFLYDVIVFRRPEMSEKLK